MSSNNYVLAEYNGETRKIQGEWSKQPYSKLIKEVKNKFNLNVDIDITVLDKKNNKYFTIDAREMKEIPKGGQIRIVKRKSLGSGGYNKGPGNKGGGKGVKGGKGGKAPMKPPGVPPASKADDAKRNSWKLGSKVEIYSEGQRKWQKGEIMKIFTDNEGEWLVIKYAGFRTKEIQRFSNYIRPIQKGSGDNKGPKQTKGGKDKKDDKGKKGKDDKGKKKEKKEKKEKKPPKVTTKSKFTKKERHTSIGDKIQENEIYIKGNKSHIKKYIDRACLLLRGTDAGTEPPKDVEIPTAGSASSSDEDADNSEDEEVVLLDPKDDPLSKKPSKTYHVIHLFGTGRSMGPVVQTAEIVKKIIPDLYQVSSLEAIEIREVWAPTEQGLKEVETIRQIPQLKVSLATDAALLDKEAVGYQEPTAGDDFSNHTIDYHYPEEDTKGGKGGKSGRGRGKGRGRGRGSGRGRGKGGSSSGNRGGRGRGGGKASRGRGY